MEEQKKIILEKVDNISGEILTKAQKNQIKYIDPTYTLDMERLKDSSIGPVLYLLCVNFSEVVRQIDPNNFETIKFQTLEPH